MKLKVSALIGLSFFIIFYTGFQGGRYFLANRIQELGLLLSLGLFVYSALLSALQVRARDLRWNWWFFATLAFIAYTFFPAGLAVFAKCQCTGITQYYGLPGISDYFLRASNLFSLSYGLRPA